MNPRVVDNLPRFATSVHHVMDDALREASRDGLIKAKELAPFKKGGLRGNTEAHKVVPLHWRISFWIEYARFQHEGGDSKRRVRKYSTSGTGKKYLKKAGDEQAEKLSYTFRKHGVRAR